MMHRLLGVVVLLAMVTLAGCSSADDPISSKDSPKANGQVAGKETGKEVWSWTYYGEHPCTGEIITGDVEDILTYSIHQKANGDLVLRYQLNSKGTLVGLVSGKKYNLKDNLMVREVNVNTGCPWSSQIQLTRIIAGGGDPNFVLRYSGKIMVDCDWNVTVQRFTDVAHCANE